MLLGVDVGGTFTDAVLVGRDSTVHTAKVPSTPAQQSAAVLDAVALVLERAGAQPSDVRRFAHGMTVTTNALLQGRTARTALIATDGFTDVIELARQARPHLYRLCDGPPAPLVPAELRFAAPERMTPDGPLRELDRDAARALVLEVAAQQPQAIAVCAAALLRAPAARAPARRADRRAAARTCSCRCRATSSAPFASSSAPPRPRSTRRSRRCSPTTCAGSPTRPACRSCPSRRSCSPRAASPTSRVPPRTPR